MIRNVDRVIAIDPDVERSGIASISLKDGKPELECCISLGFAAALRHISPLLLQGRVLVVVEAGWLNQIANYHGVTGQRGMRVAYQVGRNHQTGKLLCEMLRELTDVTEAAPLRKCWKGKDGKITHEELDRICRNAGMELPSRTNQDERDAALLAIMYSELAIRL